MTDETVLITGCSSGIGRATAAAFMEEGWTVYATARDTDDVTALKERGAEIAELDVTDEPQCREVVERVVEEQGGIDCLVNNAGYAQMGAIEDVPTRRVHDQFDVNVYGPHRLVRAVLPHMREAEDGTIVNVSSVVGFLTMPGGGVYAASKHAMESLSDALRAEVASFGVDVVVVQPGPVDTRFDQRVDSELDDLPRTEAYGDLYELYDDYSTISGVGGSQPEEVAAKILNAASATDPEPRYAVGPVAKASGAARLVPDRWRDAVFALLRKLP
jgi:NAD(P)-dependent dehydrogenase (short-subunit alcohol dehydrogenase family)